MTGVRMAGLDRRTAIVSGVLALGAAPISTSVSAKPAALVASDVLQRMRVHIGTPWQEGGVDRIIAGAPDTAVRGIATTMMATFDALKAAVAQNLNLVITHEPTFWSHQDNVQQLQNDALHKRKLEYIRANDLVVYHFHDHWHAKRPVDGINYGMAQKIGWAPFMDTVNNRKFNIPATTLGDLAKFFHRKLGDRTLRVVGDPDMPVGHVIASWGYCSSFPGIDLLDSDSDVLVIGEAQDWDLIAYAQDLVTSGRKKGLIVLGHVLSEQWGMNYCAEWLKGFVPEVPVRFVPLIEPYWNPARPVFEINTRI
jgi:putative NIF3 family GTP cyclohydrolase 1 type 2